MFSQYAGSMVLQLFDVTTREVGAAVRALPQEVLCYRPAERFGPAEQVTHLIQADAFNSKWICPQMEGKQAQLLPSFAALLAIENERFRAHELRRLNLEGARAMARGFKRIEDLAEAWELCRQKVRTRLEQVDGGWEEVVTHPLVARFRGFAWLMCVECFCFHSYYHAGQESECIKTVRLGSKIPFIFGEVNR